MTAAKLRALTGLILYTGLAATLSAASFNIQGITPIAAVKGTSPPEMPATFSVTDAGSTSAWTASLDNSPSWASLSSTSGNGAGSLTISFNTTALAAGTYNSALTLNSGGTVSRQTFSLEVITPNVIKMQADLNRPVIYALSRADTGTTLPGHLIWLNTDTEKVEKVLPMGENPTDFDLSYPEQVLYVAVPGASPGLIRVIDPVTRKQIRTLPAESITSVRAARSGRLIIQSDYSRQLINSASGAVIQSAFGYAERGVCDITGRYYFHTFDYLQTNLAREDISTDNFVKTATSEGQSVNSLPVLSGDGSRLFWAAGVYNPDLQRGPSLGGEIYASTYRGDIAFGDAKAYSVPTGQVLANLPVTSTVAAVSGDQQKLFQFDKNSGKFARTLLSVIGQTGSTASAPTPPDNSTILPPLDRLRWTRSAGALSFQVYFGTDSAAVSSATTGSAQYLGETVDLEKTLPGTLTPGTSYYWRLDAVKPGLGTVKGPLWKFTPAPLSVTPNALTVKLPRGSTPVTVSLKTSAGGGSPAAWSASESLAWLSIATTSGTLGDSLQVTIDPAGLPIGIQTGNVDFTSSGVTASLPVSLEVFDANLSKMIPDPSRPWIYALHPGAGGSPSYILFVNTDTKRITGAVPVGFGATDLAINNQESKLYVSNWQRNVIQVIDLTTRTLLAPIPSGTDVFKLNAGRAGRLYSEEQDQWIDAMILNSATGAQIGTSGFFREGDGEVDPSGRFYYHCDNNSSGAILTKYDVSQDLWTQVAASKDAYGYGTRNLVMSADGTRLFWQTRMYDSDLQMIGELGSEIYATTWRGELVVTGQKVLNANNGAVLATLPVSTTVSAVAGDQSAIFYFNPTAKTVDSLALSTIATLPDPAPQGQPPNDAARLAPLASLSWEVVPAAVKYQIYFGTDAGAVASATTASQQYLGTVTLNSYSLPAALVPPGGTFYWRVDAVGLTSTSKGVVRNFKTLPVSVSPLAVVATGTQGAPAFQVRLPVTGLAGTSWTASTSGASWLKVLTPSGATGGNLDLELSPVSLAGGSYNASVTFSSNGLSDTIPVKFTVEALKLVALKADPVRQKLYAIQRPALLAGSLLVINTITSAIEKVLPLSDNPTAMDLTPDNQFLYVITRGGRKMHRFNLDDWTSSEQPLAAAEDWDTTTVWYRVAAGAGSMVYWADGQWAPKLHSMDFATGKETSLPILADGDFGFGSISRNADGTKLTACSQYGWSAGITVAKPISVDVSGASPRVTVVELSLQRDPFDAPVTIRPGGFPTFLKKYKLDADLKTILKEYPSEVYAATRKTGLVFGTRAAWKESTLSQVWQTPANVEASICALTGDESAFFYFDSPAAKLVKVTISSLGDFPGPQPEDGEVITAMPSTLSWTPNPQALRYEIYFGSDQPSVQSAADPASPFHLGTSTTASLALNQPFATAGLWWWRVDAVLPGATVKGAVWKFSGALDYLTTLPATNSSFYSDTKTTMVMDGATILIGLGTSQYDSVSGSVAVYGKKPGKEEWRKLQNITKPEGLAASYRFATAVALKGDTAWIGATDETTGGQVFEYRRNTRTLQWSPTGRKVAASTAAASSGFGSTLNFDGRLLIVGAPNSSSESFSFAGAVEIFDASTLTKQARLTEASPAYYRYYGNVLALGDGFLAVASPSRPNTSGSGSGAVDIWTPGSTGTWSRSATIVTAGAANIATFGQSLAVSGDILFVGSPSGTGGGKVFPYRKTSATTWTPLPAIEQGGAKRTDGFNSTLAASGDFLAFGSPVAYSSYEGVVPSAWLHRRTGSQTWAAVAPAIRPVGGVLRQMGLGLAVTERYLAVLHSPQSDGGQGITVYLHNPSGNLPPLISSAPPLFAEEGKSYQYSIAATDDNAGDTLKFSALSSLPSWLSLRDKGDGTALLSGTPASGSAGTLAISLEVRDSAGGVTNQEFNLLILPAGGIPQISADTGDQTINDGQQATLSVTVNGADASYQWFQNGVLLSGETRSSLVIPHIQNSDAGTYQVRVTRNGIWIDSDPMLLTVNQVPDKFGGDWPTFGANNSHTGAYPATLGRHKFIPGWTLDKAGSNQAVTGQGRVYITSGGYFTDGNAFSAYDLNSGAKLWSFPLPSSYSINPPTYHRGRVYMQRGKGTSDYPELICADAATGKVAWRSVFGAQWERYFAPVVSDEAIYVAGGDYGGIYGFDLDGNQLFFDYQEQIDNWTPLLHKDFLYSWVGNNFRQFDPRQGVELQKLNQVSTYGGAVGGTIPAAEDNVAVMSAGSALIAVSLPDMKVLWQKSGQFSASPALRNGIAYIAGATGVETYNAKTGTAGMVYLTTTADNLPTMPFYQPILLDDTLLVSSTDTIWTFNLSTGALLQRLTGGGPLTYTDGVLLATGSDQILRTWKVNQPAVLSLSTPSLAATEDVPLDWSLTVTDPDGDIPVITAGGLPSWLKMSAPVQGVVHFTGTPLNADNGAFSFGVTANDKKSFATALSIQGFVTAVNDQPIAIAPAPISVDEDAVLPALDLAAIFSDEEDSSAGLTVTVTDNTNPALFSSLAISEGKLRAVLTPDASGGATIQLQAKDSGGLTAAATLSITVRPVNDAPVAIAPAPLVVDEDSLIPPLPLDGWFTDVDNSPSELTLAITENTNPALFSSLTLTNGKLVPVLAPDANGSATITILATDPGGLSAKTQLVINVRPVNDPPVISGVIPNLSAGGAAAPASINFAPFAKDPDTGDTLTWRVVSNTNPGLFSRLEFDAQGRLNIQYAPYLSGQATVTVEVSDAAGTTSQKSFSVDLPALPDPSLSVSSTLTLNRQTGLQEQKVTIKNIGERAIGGFEIAIHGLPANASVYNASGGTAANPIVGYYLPLAAGESVTLILEYYTPGRATLSPSLTVSPVLPREAPASSAGNIAIDRAMMMEPGAFLLEFPAVPGELYMVQYTDAGGIWRDSLVRIRAGGNRVQWIDRGAPRTSSPPGSGKSRFYRVKHLSAP